jgi:hypothetical protein
MLDPSDLDPLAIIANMSVMQQSAVFMHEIFTSYVDAGFSEAQAMQIILRLYCIPGVLGVPPDDLG